MLSCIFSLSDTQAISLTLRKADGTHRTYGFERRLTKSAQSTQEAISRVATRLGFLPTQVVCWSENTRPGLVSMVKSVVTK
jgi:hypothetical protein